MFEKIKNIFSKKNAMVVQCFMDQAVKAARALFAHVEILIQKTFKTLKIFLMLLGQGKMVEI